MASGGDVTIGLFTLGGVLPGEEEAAVRQAAASLGAAAGVLRASGYVRETPDDAPFAETLGGRCLVVAELAPGTSAGAVADAGQVVGRGAFAPITTFSRQAGRKPDAHEAAGILVVLLDNADHGRDEEFNRWYDEVHLDDVTGAAGFWGAVRGRNVADAPEEGTARYLALYSTDATDPADEHARLKEATPSMTLWHAIDQVHLGAYRRVY